MPNKTKLLIAFWLIFGLRLVLIYDSLTSIQFWIEIVFGIFAYLSLRHVYRRFNKHKKTYLISMEKLTQMIEHRINTTDGHSMRVGRLARQLAEHLKLTQEEIDAVHYAALWHDIGELQLEDRILKKRGPLTIEEEKRFRQHPELGARVVEGVPGFTEAANYIRHHHEQWDGKGYPDGKREKEIPLGARIITVVNEYDYIMNKLNVKNPKQAFLNLAGKKLDPELAELFVQIADFKLTDKPANKSDEAINEQMSEEATIMAIKSKFNKSKLLRDFGSVQFVFYHNDSFFNMDGDQKNIPCEGQVVQLLSNSSESIPKHEFVEDVKAGKTYNIQWLKIADKIYVLIFDVSHFLEYERKQEVQMHMLYRDVIHSVTHGKLLLLDKKELEKYYNEDILVEVAIQESEDVAVCRKEVGELLDKHQVDGKKKYNILLAVSEAATNIMKHATEGKMKVYLNTNLLKIIIEDNGNGIKLRDLPKSTLLEGYSNKRSMGHGFAIMLKMMERIAIYTSKEGTTIILESVLDEGNQGIPKGEQLMMDEVQNLRKHESISRME